MLKVIEGINSGCEKELMAEMFAMREDLTGFSKDERDDNVSLYLLVTNEDDVLQGSLRLRTTHHLDETSSLPKSSIIWEASRLCVVENATHDVIKQLAEAVRQIGLDNGIMQVVACLDLATYYLCQQLNFHPNILSFMFEKSTPLIVVQWELNENIEAEEQVIIRPLMNKNFAIAA